MGLLDAFKNKKNQEQAQNTSPNQENTLGTPKITQTSEQNIVDDNRVPVIVNEIFAQAVKMSASDIHFKPFEDSLVAQFRVDGELADYKSYPKDLHSPIIARIKIISGLKIDEHRLPQDGKGQFDTGYGIVDLRVSTLPSQNGEKIVIRILPQETDKIVLTDIGIPPQALLKINKFLKKSYGMIVTVGPTGSGKSTTLFAMISSLDASKKNISTLEDPIEYKIKGATQTQIKPEIGFDFCDGLRTLVRQDPDVIMVGEIRDKKTASLGIEAALTGHLVFSTLHTNTAVGTIQRLLNMGIDNFLIASACKLIISQRLIRNLCPYCREAYAIPEGYKKILVDTLKRDVSHFSFYRSKGCEKCHNLGYKGRIGLYEVLEMSPAIQTMILENAPSNEIEKKAIEEGMVTLQYDALTKTVTGDTSIEEALKILA